MCENVKKECACDIGFNNGAIIKTLENNIFTIFGNINQGNSIVIRYHGLLTEDSENKTFKMFYYFDNQINQKKFIELERCNKCLGDSFCTCINLENFSNIAFGFMDNNNNCELNSNLPFSLEIHKDPIKQIMQRYGFEQNENLPVCEDKKDINLKKFKEIINNIKMIFLSVFLKKVKSKCE